LAAVIQAGGINLHLFYFLHNDFMKMPCFILVAAVINLNIPLYGQTDCDALLKMTLERTEYSNEVDLDQSIYKYFFSKTFEEDINEGKYQGGLAVGTFAMAGDAKRKQISEFRQRLIDTSNTTFSEKVRSSFLATRGLKDLADAWLKCLEVKKSGAPKLTVSADDDAKTQFAIISVSHPGTGTPATILSVTTDGCEQVPVDRNQLGLSSGVAFEATGAAIGRFKKAQGHPRPMVVINTTIGVATIPLQSWPPPPPTPPRLCNLTEQTIKGGSVNLDQITLSEYLAKQEWAGTDGLVGIFEWKLEVTKDWKVNIVCIGRVWNTEGYVIGFPKEATYLTPKKGVTELADFSDLASVHEKQCKMVVNLGKPKGGTFTISNTKAGSGGEMKLQGPTNTISRVHLNVGGGAAQNGVFEAIYQDITISFLPKE
jgi:hypothetical protein